LRRILRTHAATCSRAITQRCRWRGHWRWRANAWGTGGLVQHTVGGGIEARGPTYTVTAFSKVCSLLCEPLRHMTCDLLHALRPLPSMERGVGRCECGRRESGVGGRGLREAYFGGGGERDQTSRERRCCAGCWNCSGSGCMTRMRASVHGVQPRADACHDAFAR
jgi:hypothetical protein